MANQRRRWSSGVETGAGCRDGGGTGGAGNFYARAGVADPRGLPAHAMADDEQWPLERAVGGDVFVDVIDTLRRLRDDGKAREHRAHGAGNDSGDTNRTRDNNLKTS